MLLGVHYLGERQVIHPLDPRFGAVLENLEKLSDGDLSTLSSDVSGQRWVVAFTHHRDPGVTYYYDHSTGGSRLPFRPYPHLGPEVLAPMTPITVLARDGLALLSYLTLPTGAEPAGLPLVHGGPWYRDGWGSTPWCGYWPTAATRCFTGARTGSDAHDAHDFWTLARHSRASLSRQRTPNALKAGSAALAEHCPSSGDDAEAMMAAATEADIQITNLGVAHPSRRSGNALTALWGPAQITQLRGEHVLGVVTVGGRLRMTELAHTPVAGLVPETGAVLAEACAEPPRA
ncbi:hypothetical protein [Streptomyces iranensis]|uniref:hypothetical protein n=1 Tax=Streptomyces iranensis TaxID=576784 RepID=UPI0039B728FF